MPAPRVKAGRGLVEEEDGRGGNEAGGDVETASHAAGVGAEGSRRNIAEIESLQQLADAAPPLLSTEMGQRGHQIEVLASREQLVDGRVLTSETDPGANLARMADDAVDMLEREGILERRPDPTDRRATRVLLTDAGRVQIAEWQEFQRQLAESAMAPLSADERRSLKRVLDKIRDGLGSLEAVRGPAGQSLLSTGRDPAAAAAKP